MNYIMGQNWIRLPSLIWSSISLYSIVIIVTEEFLFFNPTNELLAYYALHTFMAVLTLYRSLKPFPFGGYLKLVH